MPHKEGEEPGWWIGKIAKIKGEVSPVSVCINVNILMLFQLYVVEFNDGHSTYTDILEKEKLRLPNKKYAMYQNIYNAFKICFKVLLCLIWNFLPKAI